MPNITKTKTMNEMEATYEAAESRRMVKAGADETQTITREFPG